MEENAMLKSQRPHLLTLNKDNYEEVLAATGDVKVLEDNDFSGTDYVFSLTDAKDDELHRCILQPGGYCRRPEAFK